MKVSSFDGNCYEGVVILSEAKDLLFAAECGFFAT